ncbi:MAG: PcsB-like coiled-coil domain-containing protein [Solirubrobacteraceae bacterium]
MRTTRQIKRAITGSFALAVAVAVLGTSVGSSSADLTTQIQTSKSTVQSLQNQISADTQQIDRTAGGVAAARQQLAAEQAKLNSHIQQLRTVQTELMNARERLLKLEHRLQKSSAALAGNLRAQYENGNTSLVDVVLSANGFNNLLSQLSYLKDAQQADTQYVTVTKDDRTKVLSEASSLGRFELRDEALTNAIVQQRNSVAAYEAALVQRQIDEQAARSNDRSKLGAVQAHVASLQRKLNAIEAAAAAKARQTATEVNQSVGGIPINTGGMVQPPPNAPAAVVKMIAAGNAIATLPYIWGGGHASVIAPGYDCSGSVSYVLIAAGLLSSPEVSGDFESYGAPGPGKWVTIYANAGHVWMEIAGWRFDTVALAEDGTRWSRSPGEYAGFVVRHPIGL